MFRIMFFVIAACLAAQPVFAQDKAAPATVSSQDCDRKIEKALREYDAYEREDALLLPVPIEEWERMRAQMQDMHEQMDNMHKEIQGMHRMMKSNSMPMHTKQNP